jgi:hypothetical protein
MPTDQMDYNGDNVKKKRMCIFKLYIDKKKKDFAEELRSHRKLVDLVNRLSRV